MEVIESGLNLSQEIMRILESDVSSHYAVFTFENMLDVEHNHVTLMYFGKLNPGADEEIIKIMDKYFNENNPQPFEASFSKVEMFGPDKDVRVLIADDPGQFLGDLRELLEPFNASEFKDYKPHYTTDLPAPQKVKVNAVHFQSEGYTSIKSYFLGKN